MNPVPSKFSTIKIIRYNKLNKMYLALSGIAPVSARWRKGAR